MIRHIKRAKPIRIPASIKQMAKANSAPSFRQIHLDDPLPGVASSIPFPVDRQVHSLIILGSGYVTEHYDEMSGHLATAYCIPFHLPCGAVFHQEGQQKAMKNGECYSFNLRRYHGVDKSEMAWTYAAFIVVNIISKPEQVRLNKLREKYRKYH